MRSLQPRAGVHFPGSAGEFRSWFATDADCLDHLDWLRWPDGVVCPRCGSAGGWSVADGGCRCASCGARTAVTAGTMLDRRRTPLTVWIEACWVITDGWTGYRGIVTLGSIHEPRSQRAARARGQDPGELLPAAHRVASLAKRWLLGTHQGSVDEAHPQGYLDEFVFRFNRRRSRSRGMLFYRVLELAVAHAPVRYRDPAADPKPKRTPPSPPGSRGHPPSLDGPRAAQPWRAS
ncbi:MAG: IS1595 family transposase [Candidatus Nanopelagicales bacterium]